VRLLLGPAGLQWCSDALLGRMVETAAATGTGIHLHVVESPYQKQYALERFGRTAITHLHRLGVLGQRTSCAHTVWATDEDLELLAATETSVVHNASSNLRLGCGIAPVLPMWHKGVNVALGMDGTTLNDDNDMFQELRLCLRLHHPVGLFAEHLSPAQGLAMATANGARAALFGGQVGELVVGGRADIVLMNLRHFTPASMFEQLGVVETLLLCGRPAYIDTVLISGRPVLQQGQIVGFDKQAIVAELIQQAQQPSTPVEQERQALLTALEGEMLAFYHNWPVAEGHPFYLVNGRTT
jgi:cytosine/adenosine deaminase-related metal-dependent hydrolase